MRTLAKVLLPIVALSAVAAAQTAAGVAERAKREGSLTLYTSLAPTESQPLA